MRKIEPTKFKKVILLFYLEPMRQAPAMILPIQRRHRSLRYRRNIKREVIKHILAYLKKNNTSRFQVFPFFKL